MSDYKVRGYVKSVDTFHSLSEWEDFVNFMLERQGLGIDTRAGNLSCKSQNCSGIELYTAKEAIEHYFGHLSYDVERYDMLTDKAVNDFIEDFINHKFWEFDSLYGKYFSDPYSLKFSFFYSRGDIEPYVLLDEVFTQQIYGTNFNLMEVKHFTSETGFRNLQSAIDTDKFFDISTMTIRAREFFRPDSNIEVTILGNVKAAFRSDVKSLAVTTGHRAANLLRFEYPGRDKVNLCYSLDNCDEELRTGIWNEIIVTPVKILSHKIINPS